MRNFVIINGVNSNTINGLGINELPPTTKPEMRNIREEIDGRDGDIITELGYSAYDKTITIGLFGTGYDINDIVAFFKGEGTIVFSNEPDKYYNFKILNQIDYESLQKFRTASITFHCQPFKYPLNETPLEIEYDYIEDEGETLTLNNTGNATMKLDLKGNTSQTGTPTPTSPIPVSVVSGDNDVVVCGKNLLPFKNQEFTYKNVTYKVVNGELIIDGTSTGETTPDSADFKNNFAFYLEAGTYTIRQNLSAGTNPSYFFARILKYDDNTALTRISYTSPLAIFTLNERTKVYLGFYVYSMTFNNDNLEYMLVSGNYTSETIPTYEPYNGDTYELDLGTLKMRGIGTYEDYFTKNTGKNLSIKNIKGFFNAGDTHIAVDGDSESFVFYAEEGKTYTYSSQIATNRGVVAKVDTLDIVNNTPISNARGLNGQKTFTSEFTGYCLIYVNASLNESIKETFMINEGSTALSYEPYGTGQWCKYNAIGNVVLDGSETYNTNQSTDDKIRFTTNCFENNKPKANNIGLSNYLIVQVENFKNGLSMYSGDKNAYIWVLKTLASSTSDFATWVSTHNIEIDYPLSSPYLSLIEDNNLIEQLDNIQNAVSYTGQTNISQVNNDKAFIISAKALEKGTNEVVVNNIGNVYSKPLIALEGSGNVDIYLDNTQILKANVEDKMNIDIAQLEAYNPDTMTLLNRQVIGNYNSMTLQPGNNTIRIDGALDKATITNYVRWL